MAQAQCLLPVRDRSLGRTPSAIRAGARQSQTGWSARGTKAWVTHGGQADFYTAFLRTSPDPRRGRLVLLHRRRLAEPRAPAAPERKMGLKSSTTASMNFDDVAIPAERLIGQPGQGLPIALSALDAGRLGIAAVAVGIAQSAVDYAVAYARERETFGSPIIEHQGVGFMLADMAAKTEAARATYLVAARRKDSGQSYARQASIAKLIATDTAMAVTTNAVQVLGGAGYTSDHPVERFMREAKITRCSRAPTRSSGS